MKDIRTQWDDAAKAWVDFVRTGKDYYRDRLNNPAMFELLGDINKKKILDLGCGEGYNTRIMARKGAYVTGIDFSTKMIDFAIEEERKDERGIEYYVSDASQLHMVLNRTFDIVTCFMALQDIGDHKSAIKEVSRVLKSGGRFIFVIPHPCFEKRTMNGRVIGGWEYQQNENTPLYYKVDKYFDTHNYTINWNMERLAHHFETTSFHRTLTDYADALYNAGLLISRLKEPTPTEEGLSHYSMSENLRIPQSIMVESVKY